MYDDLKKGLPAGQGCAAGTLVVAEEPGARDPYWQQNRRLFFSFCLDVCVRVCVLCACLDGW